jgi:pyridoxine 4-dehydrogenase
MISPDMMSTFALGRLRVRRSGYGAMQLAGSFAFGTPPDRASAIGVLKAAVAAGIDHIDTAQYYGPGAVNELIREALYPYPDGLAVVSKVAIGQDNSDAILPFDDPGQLREGIEETCAPCGLTSSPRSISACPVTDASTPASTTSRPRWWRPGTRASSPR